MPNLRVGLESDARPGSSSNQGKAVGVNIYSRHKTKIDTSPQWCFGIDKSDAIVGVST